jgi:hypothetical protein
MNRSKRMMLTGLSVATIAVSSLGLHQGPVLATGTCTSYVAESPHLQTLAYQNADTGTLEGNLVDRC